MVGITAYGAYVPRFRISRKTITGAMGWFSSAGIPGERSVANYDEDTVTMAVAASMDCLGNDNHEIIEALYLATVTAPYKERLNAGIVATALDPRPNVRTADFCDSTKAGTTALIAACDAVAAGTAVNALVCASDCRTAKPGSFEESNYGDGAAAVIIGKSGVIARLGGSYSLSYDFMDRIRIDSDRFVHAAEDKWIRDEGYTRFIPEAISGLFKKYSLGPKDFSKVIFPCLYVREHSLIAKGLGFDSSQIQQELLTLVGDTGTTHPLMMLVSALESAKPGDRLLVASYGNGSDAMFFEVTPEIMTLKPRRGIRQHIASKKELASYEKYLSFRNVLPVERGPRGEPGPSWVTLMWRDRKEILGLHGSKCRKCGTPQFPAQRICVAPDCGAVDQMDDYSFAGKRARLFSFTADGLAFSVSPPEMYGVIDWEGGGRYIFDITDTEPESLKVDMPMEMTFRKRYADEAHAIYGYFWKAMPVRA